MKFRDDFPLPDTDWEPTRPFWAAAARGVLAVTRCDLCARYVWYPDGRCRHCGGDRLTWTAVSGRGKLFSWSVVHRAFIPQLADLVPFVTGLVEIDEDPAVRIVTRIVDCAPETLAVDMPVRVVFRPLRFAGVAGEVQAPLFAPATAA
jgi:hypothetical protein